MRTCVAAVAVLALGLLTAGPVLAHSEGLTPYRYVVAPPGVASEGPAEPGLSTQPIGPPGFAGTTDNQMQLTLPEGVLPSRPGWARAGDARPERSGGAHSALRARRRRVGCHRPHPDSC